MVTCDFCYYAIKYLAQLYNLLQSILRHSGKGKRKENRQGEVAPLSGGKKPGRISVKSPDRSAFGKKKNNKTKMQ